MSLVTLAKKFGKRPLYIVGGAVRNMLLNVEPKDIDITAPVDAEEVIDMLKGSEFEVVPSSLRMGTLIIRDGKNKYEYTAFRSDSYPEDSGEHRPIEVKFTDDINVDAMRRDFTINAIYYNVLTKQYIDPLGGMADIERRLIRTTRAPQDVFGEDGLRLLRLVRFASQLGFSVDENCYTVASSLVHLLADISVERITDEFDKILHADSSGYGNALGHYNGVKMLIDMGAMDYIIPELMAGKDYRQNPAFHMYDVLTHELEAFKSSHDSIRLVALIHDIGKPYAMERDGNMHKHDIIGSRIAYDALNRLRYPKHFVDEVVRLIRIHMFNVNGMAKERTIKSFVLDNHDIMDKFLRLRYVDVLASKKDMTRYDAISDVYEEMKRHNVPMTISALSVNGTDLVNMGIRGVKVGETLRMLLEKVVLDGEANDRENLLKIVRGGR